MSAGAKPQCPECGKPATGNFCQHCGAELGGRFCNQCGAKAGAGAAYCNQCGAKLSGRAARAAGERRAAAADVIGGQNLPWWIAGAAMFVLIVVVGVRMVQPGPAAPPAAVPPSAAPGPVGGGMPPDLSSMTPREAADRLFNRVMTSVSQGDSVGAQAFIPMAVAAYERARPLDHDGLFHLSLLNRTAMDLDAALANANEVLERDPDHVLALLAAAQAAAELGQNDLAAEHYGHLLEVWGEQQARGLPEYRDHAPIMESARSEAEAFLAGR